MREKLSLYKILLFNRRFRCYDYDNRIVEKNDKRFALTKYFEI